MKIIQINTQDIGGGAATIAYSLHHYYLNQGHESHYIVGKKYSHNSNVVEFEKTTRQFSLDTMINSYRSLIKKYEGIIFGAGYISEKMKRYSHPIHQIQVTIGKKMSYSPDLIHFLNEHSLDPDIIHFHNLHGGYFNLLQLPSISHHKPCILTAHDLWITTGGCYHPFECLSWRNRCDNCLNIHTMNKISKKRIERQWIIKQKLFQDSPISIVTPCEWLMQKIINCTMKLTINNAKVIPNGIDLSIFHPSDKNTIRKLLNLPESAFIILFTAYGIKNNPSKDFRTLLTVFYKLADINPKWEIIFLCLGDKGSSITKNQAKLIFLPLIANRETIAHYYQAADIYLHPAVQDTYPTSIIEAMACGIPVIATAVGGIPEQIIHNKTGFLTGFKDSSRIVDFILFLNENDAHYKYISKESAQYAKENCDINTMGKKYINFYNEVMSSV